MPVSAEKNGSKRARNDLFWPKCEQTKLLLLLNLNPTPMSTLRDRILNGQTFVLAPQKIKIFLYFVISSGVLLSILMWLIMPGFGDGVFFYALTGLMFLMSLFFFHRWQNHGEIWIEQQKLHIKKVKGTYEIIPFSRINKIEDQTDQGSNEIRIEYTNDQGMKEKTFIMETKDSKYSLAIVQELKEIVNEREK
jgi:hypothetical protein